METDEDGARVDCAALASALSDALGLRQVPVALAFVAEAPEGIELFSSQVPSACTFWRRAEQGVFFAPAEAHYECPIGALTMGFALPHAQLDRLMELVGGMCDNGYLESGEAENIPSIPGAKAGIVYGPLDLFPVEPDVVLVWVSGSAAMLLAEATGSARWASESSGTATFGRPSCAAVPVALREGAPTFSSGCAGMRTYTEIEADLQLAVLPRQRLSGLHQRLIATTAVNGQMREYYDSQKARFASSPSAG